MNDWYWTAVILILVWQGIREGRWQSTTKYSKKYADDNRKALETIVHNNSVANAVLAKSVDGIALAIRDSSTKHSAESYRIENSLDEVHKKLNMMVGSNNGEEHGR